MSGASQGEDAIGNLIAGITSGTAVPMKPDIEAPASKTSSKPKETKPAQKETPSKRPTKKTTPTIVEKRTLVIAIDPGHGGEDPGAVGKNYKTREKDVVLSISKILYQEINALPGFKAILTRSSDYFVPLNRRVLKAFLYPSTLMPG